MSQAPLSSIQRAILARGITVATPSGSSGVATPAQKRKLDSVVETTSPRRVTARESETQTRPGGSSGAQKAAQTQFVLYTDGSSRGNGSTKAKAGAAVWADDGRVAWSGAVPGAQTNQRAELWAAIVAAAYARTQLADTPSILVRSDSAYVVKGINEPSWLAFWTTHQWHKKVGGVAANTDLWSLLHSLLEPRRIAWEHVDAHSGVKGNEAADKLACAAALLVVDVRAAARATPALVWPAEFTGTDFDSIERGVTVQPLNQK